MEKNKKDFRETLIFLAWATSVLAMFGSLYFSEIRQFEPCELCWYQRIIMYPFVVILGIATIKKDYSISLYTMILSIIGACFSSYHYMLQKIPAFRDHSLACGRIPCSVEYINVFGFITLPFLALIAFLIIFICSLLIWKRTKEE